MDRRWKYGICVTDVVENMINLIIVVKITTIIVVNLRGEMKISKSFDDKYDKFDHFDENQDKGDCVGYFWRAFTLQRWVQSK